MHCYFAGGTCAWLTWSYFESLNDSLLMWLRCHPRWWLLITRESLSMLFSYISVPNLRAVRKVAASFGTCSLSIWHRVVSTETTCVMKFNWRRLYSRMINVGHVSNFSKKNSLLCPYRNWNFLFHIDLNFRFTSLLKTKICIFIPLNRMTNIIYACKLKWCVQNMKSNFQFPILQTKKTLSICKHKAAYTF